MKTLVASFTFTKSINYPQHHPQNGITYKIKKTRGTHSAWASPLFSICLSPFMATCPSGARTLPTQTTIYLCHLSFVRSTPKSAAKYQNQGVLCFQNCFTCTVSLFVQYYYRTLILETNTPHHGHRFHYYSCCHCQLFSTDIYK